MSFLSITLDARTGVEDILDEAFTKKRMLKESRSSRRGAFHPEGGTDDEREHGVVRDIMDENAFRYAFQPIISARTGEVVAYEALMRTMQEPKLSPLTILKYATMDERLYDIELSTFNNVLRYVEQIRDSLGDKKIFINSIPGHYLSDTDYRKIRHRYKDLFSHLVVEITEETDLEGSSLDILRDRCREDHFEVAVDDFGTGYSNMSNLLKFLPNYVKVDRTLIENVQEDPKKQHFVKTIIEFAHDNGFQALAEGVETSRELQAVIRMGIDLVQGYYTAKPAFGLTEAISVSVRDEIVKANFDESHERSKKVYLVNREKELFLMQLAMERYTGLILSQPDLTLHGNPDFMAGITVRVKEGCNCRLRISNVRLGDVDSTPCIDIGKGASLTLVLDGNNEFDGNGIHVPEDASLRIEGNGNLTISPVLSKPYGIGAEADSPFGRIECAQSGTIILKMEGSTCVGIGGGRCQSGEGIRILSGAYELGMAGTDCVGIGSFEGEVSITLANSRVAADARIGSGVVVGALKGRQNIEIRDASLTIEGSGSSLVGVGGCGESGGSIRINNAGVHIRFNGREIFLLGARSGQLGIAVANSNLELLAEGNFAVGLGTVDEEGDISLLRSRLDLTMRVGDPHHLGVKKNHLLIKGGRRKVIINETEIELEADPD